ncbi:MAG: hypothetical protein KA151_15045 [Piscinibacter sp.]|nr:hypothetical protein [Piscinibacter sp.]
MNYSFRVEFREAEFPGRQITADVVRNDGKVVRSGMWPDFAQAECELLNEYAANSWTAAKYHEQRRERMAKVRAA